MSKNNSLENVAQSYFCGGHLDSALYWTDKFLTIEGSSLPNSISYIRCLEASDQNDRAISFIRRRSLENKSKITKYLLAKCLFKVGHYEEAVQTIEAPLEGASQVEETGWNGGEFNKFVVGAGPNIDSSLLLLLGKIHEVTENRQQAANAYCQALKLDVFCYEALWSLVSSYLLNRKEELELLDSLQLDAQCKSFEEANLVRFLYHCRLNKFSTPEVLVVPDELQFLGDNPTVLLALAERHYYNNNFKEAFSITSKLLLSEDMRLECLMLHISLLIELKKPNELFVLAHRLVDQHSSLSISWYAVGCYYYCIGSCEPAKRYLNKCTSLSPTYGPGWLVYGHSFAVEGEHDQAMNCYMKAAKVMRGCHLPFLYIGLEYSMTNNLKLSDKFFQEAVSMAPDDPYMLHELGVLAFRNEDFPNAERYFLKALHVLENAKTGPLPPTWEPLLNNLAHVYRKLKRFNEALCFHSKALLLFPQSSSTIGAIGYTYLLSGTAEKAIEYFHRCLSLKRDNAFITTMLSKALDLAMEPLSGAILTKLPEVRSQEISNIAVLQLKKCRTFEGPSVGTASLFEMDLTE